MKAEKVKRREVAGLLLRPSLLTPGFIRSGCVAAGAGAQYQIRGFALM